MSYLQPWLSRAEKVVMCVLLFAAVGVMLACGGGPVGPVPAVLLGYPRSPALDEVIQTHIDAGSDAREERVLLTTNTGINVGDQLALHHSRTCCAAGIHDGLSGRAGKQRWITVHVFECHRSVSDGAQCLNADDDRDAPICDHGS